MRFGGMLSAKDLRMNLLRFGVLVVVLSVACLLAGGLAPQPDALSRRWMLDTTFGPLRVLSVETPAGPRAFYYMTFKAVNNSGREQVLAPSFELVDGDGVITRAGRDVPSEAVAAAMARLNNPLLQDPISTIGPIGTGIENAKEGLVLFAAEDLTPGPVTVYAAGFSGETALVRPPGEGARLVILRRTRELRFHDPGDLGGRRDVPLDLVESGWVMR